ncbi:MAG: type II secretion system protein M [Sedimentisphaerales bacterium]|nr:type II secretion system protein M [Sedimentisphaerales bacterium]
MRLTRREKRLLAASVLVAAVWLSYAAWLRPARQRLETLDRVIPQKQQALLELTSLTQEYVHLQQQAAQARIKRQSAPEDFTLLGYLEAVARQCQVYPVSMEAQQPGPQEDSSETVVIMEFEEIAMDQLVGFLARVRSEAPVWLPLQYLHISRNPQGKRLNCTLQICHARFSDMPAEGRQD